MRLEKFNHLMVNGIVKENCTEEKNTRKCDFRLLKILNQERQIDPPNLETESHNKNNHKINMHAVVLLHSHSSVTGCT